jgi:subtilase family serine protease
MISTPITARRSAAITALAAAALVAIASPATATTAPTYQAASSSTAALPSPVPLGIGRAAASGLSAPLSTEQCQQQLGVACFSPAQMRAAYNLNPLYERGITGKGSTILIVDPLGSPTIQQDLNTYDQQWGLPPATVHVINAGAIPPFDPTSPDSVGWAGETTFDVELAHTFAPGATIDLLVTSVSETLGVTGFPQIDAALQSEVNQGVGDVVSMSFGAPEPGFPSASALTSLRGGFQDAAKHGVTLVASAGDTGAAGLEDISTGALSTDRETSWPATDPDVTAVGGIQLQPDSAGNPQMPGTAWNEPAIQGATGGGLSTIFARPGYQNLVRSVVGTQRGIPDIALSAAVNGGVWVYMSYPGSGGWGVYGGTSEGAPTFSAMIALADQVAGHRLGNVDQALYQLYAHGGYAPWTGLLDVTEGNNSIGSVTGYNAGPGYDLTTGVGTVNADRLIPALAGR